MDNSANASASGKEEVAVKLRSTLEGSVRVLYEQLKGKTGLLVWLALITLSFTIYTCRFNIKQKNLHCIVAVFFFYNWWRDILASYYRRCHHNLFSSLRLSAAVASMDGSVFGCG